MAEFDDLRQALAGARADRASSQRELFVARERVRAVGRRRDEAIRRGADEQQLAAIAAEERRLQADAERLAGASTAADEALLDVWTRFEPFADPIENVGRLDDSTPILLMPLRIETRFQQVVDDDVTRDQLWVRAYPDDIAVNTFEEVLAEVEISNARIYWTNVWKAGGDDGAKRAAWRSLAISHGPGRAKWIIEQVAPLNPADEPVVAPGEHLLVIVTDQPLPGAERGPARDYWSAVAAAAGDEAAVGAALDALTAAVGSARAATIATEYVPQNLAAPIPATDPPATIRVEFLDLPDQATIDSQQLPWMHAARTAVLPERLVVLGFDGGEQTLLHVGRPIPSELSIGPDPAAPQDDQLRLEDGELVVPEPMRWMTDFDVAVENGMGFRIDLEPIQARAGFDRLFVLGVRISADPEAGAADLERLIADHQRSRKGFSLVGQGAPTNNVEDDVSGYTWRDDTDLSYDHFFGQDPTDDPDHWRARKDGRWLAEHLGVDADLLKSSLNYFGTDQAEARAMNEALFPATLGYLLDQMMEPVLGDDAIVSTRAWFNRYVVGRGTIPAVRVGHQPYGILPVTPFSRMEWINRKLLSGELVDTGIPDQFRFVDRMHRLIKIADEQWTELAGQVSYVGKPGVDPHQALLDVVGLHPSSVEYYQRYAETAEQLYNRFKLSGIGAAFLAALIAIGYVRSGLDLLADLGYERADDEPIPEILNKLFLDQPNLLKGPVIDDVPLSETAAIRAYRPDGTNYLDWLAEAARLSHDAVRRQEGFLDDKPPTALLYLMLRHALDVGYVTTGIQFHLEAGLLDVGEARRARREPKFVHIQDAQLDTGSPWQYLYASAPEITGDAVLRVGDFIPTVLTLRNPYLNTQIEAIERLRQAPTARLERAFAEHIDLCTNRLDAWWLGLVNVQLEVMRALSSRGGDIDIDGDTDGDGGSGRGRRGCYLGAYAWVENLRPDHRRLEPVELPPELQPIFDKPGQAPLGFDDRNFGYIHAPSLDHAVTAAVLRNGYLANATPSNPDSLSVNLSSERVRLAMGVIEGMRNGQSLGALLGYQLERGLHDRPGLFLDSVIFELRGRFPLMANRFSTTRVAGDTAIQAIEARNVVDGLALVQHVAAQTGTDRQYPWGLGADLPDITDATARAAIDAEVDRIADINDAVADLAMAESVYQVVRGNYDRAASTLDAYSKGNFPPIPEVVQTPRSGVTLTHRVGIHLEADLDPDDAANSTPRAKGEPAINALLASVLPATGSIYCLVDIADPGPGGDRTVELTADDLGLLPIDLLYSFHRDGEQDMAAIDDLVVRHVVATEAPRPDAEIRIRYRDRQPGEFSMFEVASLVADMHDLLLRSRPLRATDTRLPNEARTTEEDTAAIRPVKVTRVRDLLDARRIELDQYAADLATMLDDPDPDAAAANAIDAIDTLIDDYAAIADAMNRFGLPGAGLGFAWDWRRRTFADLAALLDDLVARWDVRRADFQQRIADFPGLAAGMTVDEQMAYLLDAALLISTAVIVPPASGVPQDLLDLLTTTTLPAFDAQHGVLAAILPAATTVTGLYRAIEAQTPAVALHDPAGLDVGEHGASIVAFAATLRSKAESLLADVAARIDGADADVAAAASASPADAIELLTGALRRLTSADFVVLPEFTIGAEHAAEWQGAYDDRDALLAYLRNDLTVDFPVDDWLYGIARVREKMERLEGATVLTEALTGSSLGPTPVQFPRRDDDAWLALRFPEVHPVSGEPFTIDEDKLLYTAHYPAPFNAAAPRHCGVLVDEWTEVIPTTDETTGIAFHYDRPNNEAPQTLLLALPADFTGRWEWADLVDSLHETLDMARKRAVEPRHVDTTAYARFLPATLSSVTRYPILQMLDLAFNNAVQFATE